MGALNNAEFWNLGLREPVLVSALHGVGTAELLEQLFASIVKQKTAGVPNFGTKVLRLQEAKLRMNSKKQRPVEDDIEFKQERPEEVNIAIIGRPNVGKSSLLNCLTRAIVSEMAGTTRDLIDAVMEQPGKEEGDYGQSGTPSDSTCRCW